MTAGWHERNNASASAILRGTRGVASLGEDFNRADLWVLDFRSERDLNLPVGNLDGNRLDISAAEAAGLDPRVEVLELCSLDLEREDALAGSGDALEGFREVQLDQVFPVRHGPSEGVHAVVFRPIELGTLRVGDLDVRPRDGLAALEALLGLPYVAFGILNRLGTAGLDPDGLCDRVGSGTGLLALGDDFHLGKVAYLAREFDLVAVGRQLAGVGDASLSVLDVEHLDERDCVAVHLAFLQFGFALPVFDFRIGLASQLRAFLLEREGVFLM